MGKDPNAFGSSDGLILMSAANRRHSQGAVIAAKVTLEVPCILSDMIKLWSRELVRGGTYQQNCWSKARKVWVQDR